MMNKYNLSSPIWHSDFYPHGIEVDWTQHTAIQTGLWFQARNNVRQHGFRLSAALRNQPHYAVDEKNESLLNLQSILDACDKKIEVSIKPKYQDSVSEAYALPVTIKGRESRIIIHVMKWGEVKIHGISDDARIFNK